MRFLCLHGRGTNSNILEAQLSKFDRASRHRGRTDRWSITAALRSRLSAQHSFDFLDAEHTCVAAPGIAALYPSPYFCWYERGGPGEVKAALEFLVSVIEEDGPYDGVIGFSEGAALLASLLLFDEYTSTQPRFKIAILFSSVIPLVPERGLGQPLAKVVEDHEDAYLSLLSGSEEGVATQERGSDLSQAFCFSAHSELEIPITTIHVMGAEDPFVESSRTVVDLCKRGLAHVLLHQGGHELPQAGSDLNRCTEMIETAVLLSGV